MRLIVALFIKVKSKLQATLISSLIFNHFGFNYGCKSNLTL